MTEKQKVWDLWGGDIEVTRLEVLGEGRLGWELHQRW